MESEESCIISDLLQKPFSRRNAAEKIEIVRNNRPCPEIPNLTSNHKDKNGKYVRHFKISQYVNIPWLAGSKKLNKLFCWPCLLFSTDNGVWSKNGFVNLNCLSVAVSRHEKSVSHLKSFISLNIFGRTSINHQLNEHQRISDQMHNEKVKKNHDILKRLIDVVCFLGKQDLPFHGHDESDTSHKKGNYIELLELIRLYDPLLENHLKESTVFRDTSSAIQNDLIVSISSVITDRIKQELEQTEFVALILDETSDIINKSQLSTVLRFVDQNGKTRERFLYFTDISSHRSAVAFLENVKIVLNDFKCGSKLIAQTYDGTAVMADQVNSLNVKVKELYPTAVFVHCYGHMLNLTLQQSSLNIKECRVFFQTLSGLSEFFSMSSKQTYALQCFVEKKFPSVTPTRWNFASRLVNTVMEKYDMIIMFFQDLLEHTADWDNDTVIKSQGFLSFLQKFQTRFLLNVFSQVFSFTDVLSNILQTKGMDIAYSVKKVEETTKKLEEIRECNFRKTFEEVTETRKDCEPPLKKYMVHSTQDITEYKCLFVEIMDNIIMQIKSRFQSMGKLDFFCLLNSNMYDKYKKDFPEKSLKTLEMQYGAFFDIIRLRNELSVLYCLQEFKHKPVFELIKFMSESGLQMGLKEVYKLATLIATIPTTTATAERTFSALQRIKTYCKSTQGQERLSSLAVLSIEKALLDDLKIRPTFYDEVIQKFIMKNRRTDFTFK
ncbi:zinc finger MYM-type protein 1-like [Centruroides vittatus]|uniref:zinc finger MYM-type protein 1-like n=1 Tax=Centruroides vittatus TaxID=120091 RepID=UPI0035102C67